MEEKRRSFTAKELSEFLTRIMEEYAKEFLTTKDVAGMMKVSERTVKTWLKSGDLPAFKIGNVVRIERKALEKFLEENTKVD
jgi:excisionase family DNA binding protein